MKLTIFRSDKGDCLLLRSPRGKLMLIDGGMPSSFSRYVAPALRPLGKIDVIYISHIDQDHIGGVLRLLRGPKCPQIGGLWHNGFPIEASSWPSVLRRSSRVLRSGNTQERKLAQECEDVALSIAEAVEVQLRSTRIPLNAPAQGGLMMLRAGKARSFAIGDLHFRILGPAADDMKALHREWNAWLATHRSALARLRKLLDDPALTLPVGPAGKARLLYEMLGGASEDAALSRVGKPKPMGRRAAVTVPNLASLMFLLSCGRRTMLLTGDGHCDDVLEGLERHGALPEKGALRVDVLKVQHHGSRNNITPEFCRRVIADHYVFCGNGKHGNPPIEVVEMVVASRRDDRKFKLWFNSSPKAEDAVRRHMSELRTATTALGRRNRAMAAEFLEGASFELQL